VKENNENEWIKSLMKDLEKLEDVHEPKVPEPYQFLEQIHEYKEQRKKEWKRELAAFIFTALAILISYFVISYKMPLVFLWIQVLAIVTIPIIYSAEKKRRSNTNGVFDDGF